MKKASENDMANLWPLFSSLKYDPTLDALIHGYHGAVFCDDLNAPNVAYGHVGWNYYIVGNANHEHANTLIQSLPQGIEIHCSEAWKEKMYTLHPLKVTKKTRYAMDHTSLKKDTLRTIINQYNDTILIRPIDENMYQTLLTQTWSKDFVINFKTKEDFLKNGKGYVALDKTVIAGGVSSFSRFNEGYDIEIITHKQYRRQGIATLLGAYFALQCLKENKIPYWDAAHLQSVALAEKLGYTLDHAYEILVIQANNHD